MIQRHHILKFVLTFASWILLQACNDIEKASGASPTLKKPESTNNDGKSNVITATLTKGPVSGATCNLHEWSDGTLGAKVADSVTSDAGSVIFGEIDTEHDEKTLVIVCEGGSYTDESDSTLQQAGKMRTVVRYSGGTLKVAITPITEVAFQRVNSQDLNDFESKAKEISRSFGLPESVDPLRTIPRDANEEILGSDGESRYSAVLATMAMYGRTEKESGKTRHQTLIDHMSDAFVFATGSSHTSGFTASFTTKFNKAVEDLRRLKPAIVNEQAMPQSQVVATAGTNPESDSTAATINSVSPDHNAIVPIHGIYSEGVIISGVNNFTLYGKQLKGHFHQVTGQESPRNLATDTIGWATFGHGEEPRHCLFYEKPDKDYSEMTISCFIREVTPRDEYDTLKVYNRQNEIIFTSQYTVTLPVPSNVHRKALLSVPVSLIKPLRTSDLTEWGDDPITTGTATSFKVNGQLLQYLSHAIWGENACTTRSINEASSEMIFDCGSQTIDAGTTIFHTLAIYPGDQDTYTRYFVNDTSYLTRRFQVTGTPDSDFTASDGLTAIQKQLACDTEHKLYTRNDDRSITRPYEPAQSNQCDYGLNEENWFKTLWSDGSEAFFADGDLSTGVGQTIYPIHIDSSGGFSSAQLANLPKNTVREVSMCAPSYANGNLLTCNAHKHKVKALGCGANKPNVYQIKNVPFCDMAYVYRGR